LIVNLGEELEEHEWKQWWRRRAADSCRRCGQDEIEALEELKPDKIENLRYTITVERDVERAAQLMDKEVELQSGDIIVIQPISRLRSRFLACWLSSIITSLEPSLAFLEIWDRIPPYDVYFHAGISWVWGVTSTDDQNGTLGGSRHSTLACSVWWRSGIDQLALLFPFYSKTSQTSTVVSVKRIRFSLILSWRNKPIFH
jgi:hypothetical protein